MDNSADNVHSNTSARATHQTNDVQHHNKDFRKILQNENKKN
jgi:hypothetical protein